MAKIALVKRSLAPFGGLEKYTRIIGKYFVEKGHEVYFLSEDRLPQCKTYRYIKLPSKGFFSYQRIKNFDQFVELEAKKHHFDCILGLDRISYQTHLRAGNGCHRAFLAKRRLVDPLYKTAFHPINPINKTILEIERRGFESPTTQKIIVNSNMVKEEICNFYNVKEEKIAVVHNGVQWSELQDVFDQKQHIKKDLLKALKLEDTFFFLFIGNGYERKGLRPLMQALERIKEPWHLLVIGKEKKQTQYEQLAKQLQISDRISFLGYQTDIQKFFCLSDCVTIPSLYDPFANVTVEALAHGCFVLTSAFNGGAEVIKQESGLVIDQIFNIDSFEKSLREAMKHKKTNESAAHIRNSISHLDFEEQLKVISELCLN